jgi:hypothetical protein
MYIHSVVETSIYLSYVVEKNKVNFVSQVIVLATLPFWDVKLYFFKFFIVRLKMYQKYVPVLAVKKSIFLL